MKQAGRNTVVNNLFPLVIAIGPFLFLFLCIARFAVDVPYWDGWGLVPYLEKSYGGLLSVSDLFDQHTESRIFFPRIVMIALAHLTGWDTRYEMWAVFVMASFAFLVLAHQCARTQGSRSAWLVAICSVLIFSVLQHECWTWGFTLGAYMSVFFVAAGLYLLASDPFSGIRFAGALLAGLIASYSFANGVFYWIAGPLALVAPGRKRKTLLAVWIAVAAAVLVPYFIGYQRPEFATPVSDAVRQPIVLAGYLFAFLGGAIVNIPNAPLSLPIAVGATGFLFFTLGAAACFRGAGTNLKSTGFWLALGIYALLSALASALGRSGMTVQNALASRYTMFSGLFWISTVVIAVSVFRERTNQHAAKIRRLHAGMLVFAAICAGLFIVSAIHGFRIWREQRYPLQRSIRNEFLSFRPDKTVLNHTFPVPVPKAWTDFLVRHRLTVFGEKREFAEYRVTDSDSGSVESAQGDLFPDRIFPGGSFSISGSAHDPDSGRRARAVLLVDSNGVIIARSDTALFSGRNWTVELPAVKLPFRVSRIGVYALSRDGARAAEIGELALEKIPLSEMMSVYPIEFIDRPGAVVGHMDHADIVACEVRCGGWARNPVTDEPGEWVLVADQAGNILAYCKVGNIREDVAEYFNNRRLLYSGWHVIFQKNMLEPGVNVLQSYLLLTDELRALRLDNEFELDVKQPCGGD